jgi:hypothetical protein
MSCYNCHLQNTCAPCPAQVRKRLPEAGDPRVRNKLAALLQHAARGVAANPTAVPADLLLFCHGVLEDGGHLCSSFAGQYWPCEGGFRHLSSHEWRGLIALAIPICNTSN